MGLIKMMLKPLVVWPARLAGTLITAPFKLLRFMLDNALLIGLLGLIRLVCRSICRLLKSPLVLGMACGAVVIYVVIDEERRQKVLATLGL